MILNYDQRIFEAAASDPGRYAMHGVLFQTVEGTTYATATDGRKLVKLEITLEEGDELPERGVILDARELKSGWGRGKGSRHLKLSDTGWTLRVDKQISQIATIDGEFPKYESVAPPSSSQRMISFNVNYLMDIAKAAGVDQVTLEVPEFQPVKGTTGLQALDAIRIRLMESGSRNDLAVLMPVTVD